MLWMIPLAMAAMGAMADKKNPVRGAAIGAGIGLTGGAAAGGLLGAGAAGAGAAGAGAAGASAAGAAGLGAAGGAGGAAFGNAGLMYAGADAAAAGTLGGGASVAGGSALGASSPGLLGMASQYGKPAMQAFSTAQNSGLLGGNEQPAQPQPIAQAGGGSQILAALAQQGDPSQMLQQAQMKRRQRRMGLLGGQV